MCHMLGLPMAKVSVQEYEDANEEVICWCGETDPYVQASCPMTGCGLPVEDDDHSEEPADDG